MTHLFVTHFDNKYVDRGLVMIETLLDLFPSAQIMVVCMDRLSSGIVTRLHPDVVTEVYFEDALPDDVLALRYQRSGPEFFWTVTPWVIRAAFERIPNARSYTYVDADIAFFTSPEGQLEEFFAAKESVQITSHDFGPSSIHLEIFGKYNVQFVSFKRDLWGSRILTDWARDCFDWCFNRLEDEKFGDQKYLDSWENRYPERVKVASPPERFQGPWNAEIRTPRDAVTYHFHSLRDDGAGWIRLFSPNWKIPHQHLRYFYRPYVARLIDARARLGSLSIAGSTVRPKNGYRDFFLGLRSTISFRVFSRRYVRS